MKAKLDRIGGLYVYKENIRVLFAGLGGKDYVEKHKAPFEEAAKLSGEDYVITVIAIG